MEQARTNGNVQLWTSHMMMMMIDSLQGGCTHQLGLGKQDMPILCYFPAFLLLPDIRTTFLVVMHRLRYLLFLRYVTLSLQTGTNCPPPLNSTLAPAPLYFLSIRLCEQ